MGNKNKTISFRVNEDAFETLREIAEERDISLSAVLFAAKLKGAIKSNQPKAETWQDRKKSAFLAYFSSSYSASGSPTHCSPRSADDRARARTRTCGAMPASSGPAMRYSESASHRARASAVAVSAPAGASAATRGPFSSSNSAYLHRAREERVRYEASRNARARRVGTGARSRANERRAPECDGQFVVVRVDVVRGSVVHRKRV